MAYWTRNGEYYEGDRMQPWDVEVPPRPSWVHDWNGSTWVENPTRAAERDAAAVQEQDIVTARQYGPLAAIRDMRPSEVQAWVDANVTNLAQAKEAIKTLAVAISILARRL